MVSRRVRTMDCIRSARMAASMRGVRRRVIIGWRWRVGGCRSGDVGEGAED